MFACTVSDCSLPPLKMTLFICMESPAAYAPRLAQFENFDVGIPDFWASWPFFVELRECVVREDGKGKAPARPSA